MGYDSKSKLMPPGQQHLPETGDSSDLVVKDDSVEVGKEPSLPSAPAQQKQPPPLLLSSLALKWKQPEENQSFPRKDPSKSTLKRFRHRPDCPVAQTGLCSCFRELVMVKKTTEIKEKGGSATPSSPPPPKVVAGCKKSGKTSGKGSTTKKRPPTPMLRYKQDSKTFASPYRFPSEVQAPIKEDAARLRGESNTVVVEPSGSVTGDDAFSGSRRRSPEVPSALIVADPSYGKIRDKEKDFANLSSSNAVIDLSSSVVGEDATSGSRRRSHEMPSALVVADPFYGKIREEDFKIQKEVVFPVNLNAFIESSASVVGEDASFSRRRKRSEVIPSLLAMATDPSYGQLSGGKDALKKAEETKKGGR